MERRLRAPFGFPPRNWANDPGTDPVCGADTESYATSSTTGAHLLQYDGAECAASTIAVSGPKARSRSPRSRICAWMGCLKGSIPCSMGPRPTSADQYRRLPIKPRIASRWSTRCSSKARSAAAVQGLGTALYEEIPYDETGQPLAGTLADYLLPGAEVNETSITPRRVMAAIRKAGEAAPKP